MNVILGLCHKRKLSKTSRLLRQAATGNCPDRLGWVTAHLTTAITCDVFESLRLGAKKDS